MDNVSSSLNIDSEEKLNDKNKTGNTHNESVNVIDDNECKFDFFAVHILSAPNYFIQNFDFIQYHDLK